MFGLKSEKKWYEEMETLLQVAEEDIKWYDMKNKFASYDHMSPEEKFKALKFRYAVQKGMKNKIILGG